MTAKEQDILIAKFVSGEANPDEAMLLADWLSEHPENRSTLKAAMYVFNLKSLPNATTAWQHLAAVNQPNRLRRKVVPLAAAAAILLMLCFGWWFNRPHPVSRQTIAYTGDTDYKAIHLPDGSSVRLRVGSRLIALGYRHFRFSGSGEFNIRHDPTAPVKIDMGKLFIKDLGTRFTIKTSLNRDTVSIEVLEGKVLLNAVHEVTLVLNATEKALFIQSAQRLVRFNQPKPVFKSSAIFQSKKKIIRHSVMDSNTIIKPVVPVPAKTMIIKPVKPDTNKIKPIE